MLQLPTQVISPYYQWIRNSLSPLACCILAIQTIHSSATTQPHQFRPPLRGLQRIAQVPGSISKLCCHIHKNLTECAPSSSIHHRLENFIRVSLDPNAAEASSHELLPPQIQMLTTANCDNFPSSSNPNASGIAYGCSKVQTLKPEKPRDFFDPVHTGFCATFSPVFIWALVNTSSLLV
jgi:hypothetical protein